jgi:hypothetical protein
VLDEQTKQIVMQKIAHLRASKVAAYMQNIAMKDNFSLDVEAKIAIMTLETLLQTMKMVAEELGVDLSSTPN